MATKTESGGELLRAWREAQGLTCQQVANELKVTQARVSQLECGDTPSLRLSLKIELLTKGAVRVQSWHPAAAGEKGRAA